MPITCLPILALKRHAVHSTVAEYSPCPQWYAVTPLWQDLFPALNGTQWPHCGRIFSLPSMVRSDPTVAGSFPCPQWYAVTPLWQDLFPALNGTQWPHCGRIFSLPSMVRSDPTVAGSFPCPQWYAVTSLWQDLFPDLNSLQRPLVSNLRHRWKHNKPAFSLNSTLSYYSQMETHTHI